MDTIWLWVYHDKTPQYTPYSVYLRGGTISQASPSWLLLCHLHHHSHQQQKRCHTISCVSSHCHDKENHYPCQSHHHPHHHGQPEWASSFRRQHVNTLFTLREPTGVAEAYVGHGFVKFSCCPQQERIAY